MAQGERYGHGDALAGQRINLEFVSANPTGPIHAGGGRWVAVGDALANLLAAQGAEVHREYYLNDAGNQLDTFAASLMARIAGELPPEDGYQGEYLVDMAARCAAELGDDVTRGQAREWGYQRRGAQRSSDDLGRIGVQFDTWFSERTLHESRRRHAGARRAAARVASCTRRRRHVAARPPTSAISATGSLVKSDGDTTYLLRRHRVPPGQVRARVGAPHRHLGRRPPRPGEVAAGRHGSARIPRG